MVTKGKEAIGLAPLPYYKWHWQRFRANRRVQRMDYIARGLYRELLDEQWADGSIPNDMDELADICGCPVDVMREKWPQITGCFNEAENGGLFNQVLEDQRTEIDAGRIAMAAGGRRGGKKCNSYTRTQVKGIEANAKPTLEPPSTYPDIEEREEKRRVEERREETTSAHRKTSDERVGVDSSKQKRVKGLTEHAQRCHAAYPRKVAREDSLRAFIKHIAKIADREHISDAEAADWMISRVKAYTASPSVSGTPMDKIPYPASWANAGRYDDPSEEWEVKPIHNGGNYGGNDRSTAQRRQDNSFAAIDSAFESLGLGSHKDADEADEGGISESGTDAGNRTDLDADVDLDDSKVRIIDVPAVARALVESGTVFPAATNHRGAA